jgi:hypothetical protein
MSNEQEFHVNTARDALSLLTHKMYAKFGKEALPEIEDVWHKLGLSAGEKMKKNLPDPSLVTVAQAFVDGARRRGTKVDILELTEKKFHAKGYKCAIGLTGKDRELCWACMGSDRGIFEATMGKPIKMTIISTLAANDDCCEIIIELS